MRFYLGTHRAHWLELTDVPLFVSHRQLRNRRTLPRAIGPWALDSGAFSEIAEYGEWRESESAYIAAVARYAVEIGNLEWAAPMDWMVEPHMIERTGLSIGEHQRRTTHNFIRLREREPDLPWVPVLQGWTLEDYQSHAYVYFAEGVLLDEEPRVGLGSICRRQNTAEIGQIVHWAHEHDFNIHGFGVKRLGLERYGHALDSADSLAWSYDARRAPRLDGCTHRGPCQNCLRYALRWRDETVRRIEAREDWLPLFGATT